MENVSQINSGATVTVEDVAAACEMMGVNAAETNSNKVRQNLGRGSLSTIQKHLQSLRDDAARVQEPPTQTGVPPVPTEVHSALNSLWNAAYLAASRDFAGQLVKAWSERDLMRESVITWRADVESLTDQLDEEVAASVQAKADRETAIEQRNEAVQSLLSVRQSSEEQVEQIQAAAVKESSAAAHRAELNALERTIERQSLQSTIDRLTDQIGELKGLLSLQARPPQVVPVETE